MYDVNWCIQCGYMVLEIATAYGLAMTEWGRWLVPVRRADTSDRSGSFTRLPSRKIHQARVCLPALPGKKSPDSEESGDFPLLLFVPIRRAGTSDRSGGFTRVTSSKTHQSRVWPPALPGKKSPDSGESGDFALKLFVPIRRAETSDRSGGFTRVTSSKTHQSRVWPPALPG